MIPLLTYSINSIYDELMRYGWALMNVIHLGNTFDDFQRQAGMTFEYCFCGGGFKVTLTQADSGQYFIKIYNKSETEPGYLMIAISDSVPYRSWMRVLQISTGDMIRLLYGDPLTFGLRLKRYEVETVLEEL